MPASMAGFCRHCGAEVKLLGALGRKEECLQCHGDLHSCLHCEFYDTSSYNSCREPSAEVVREKDRSNFCDYFSFLKGKLQEDPAKELLSEAEALFKKS